KEAYLIRSLNGILHHQTPVLSNLEEPPACEKFSASFGREANQNKPFALIIPLGYSSRRYFQKRSGCNGFGRLNGRELMPYSAVSGVWFSACSSFCQPAELWASSQSRRLVFSR